MKNKYLIDTSIWIEFFRGRIPAIKYYITKLLEKKLVVVNGVIVSELLVGAKEKKEISFVKKKMSALDYLNTDRDFYTQCGELDNQIRKKGANLPLSDIMIATHARLNKLIVFTMDKHFEVIGRDFGIQFLVIKDFT